MKEKLVKMNSLSINITKLPDNGAKIRVYATKEVTSITEITASSSKLLIVTP